MQDEDMIRRATCWFKNNCFLDDFFGYLQKKTEIKGVFFLKFLGCKIRLKQFALDYTLDRSANDHWNTTR